MIEITSQFTYNKMDIGCSASGKVHDSATADSPGSIRKWKEGGREAVLDSSPCGQCPYTCAAENYVRARRYQASAILSTGTSHRQ